MNFKKLQTRSAHWMALLALCMVFAQSLGLLHQSLHALGTTGSPQELTHLHELRTGSEVHVSEHTRGIEAHNTGKISCLLFDAACGLHGLASASHPGLTPVQVSSLRTAGIPKSEPALQLITAAAQARAPPALF